MSSMNFYLNVPEASAPCKVDFDENNIITAVEWAFDEEDYFPGLRATGFGNPPSWDCHFHYVPKVGDKMPEIRKI
jgi:hypothetical protein